MQYHAIALLGGLFAGTTISANAANVARLPDCTRAGESLLALDLSTTNATNWTVSGPAQVPSMVPPPVGGPTSATLTAWSVMSGYWVQPFVTGTAAWDGAAEGDYTYRIQFYLPCSPKSYTNLSLSGAIAADDSFNADLNGNPIASCGGLCFKNVTSFVASGGFVSGLNTLTVVVHNQVAYTGLAIRASLSATCGRECCNELPVR